MSSINSEKKVAPKISPTLQNKPKLSISVCILTKNDEKVIEECILSVNKFAKDIIIMDMQSKDDTVKIARKYTSRIFSHKFNNDYAAARNSFLKYVSGEWVLYLDAHERIPLESQKLFNAKLLNKKNIAYMIKIVEMFQDKEVENYSCRLFRRRSDIKFRNVLNESVIADVQGIASKEKLLIEPSEIVIDRHNYQKYFYDSGIHRERVEIAKHGLEDDTIEPTVRLFYKLSLGLSLNSLGERDEAEKELDEVFEGIRKLDKKAIYNIPMFEQPYLFYGFKYCKQEKYEDSEKVLAEGVDIYNNSLTMLIRYAELLYVNKHFKQCLDVLAKIRMLINDDNFYKMEPINFNLIRKLTMTLEEKAYRKYETINSK